jgi:hypothetical protein
METEDLVVLITAQLANLTSAQMAKISTDQLDALTTEQINSLSTIQLRGLTASQFSAMETDDLVAIASEEAFYVLKFNRDAVAGADAAALASEEGIEAAFELQHEVSDKVQGGVWVGDCFVYTNAALRGRGGHHPGAP